MIDLNSLSILGGIDKDGLHEMARVDIAMGQICCLVGPTGAGKSRLLADIEWLAQGDTPSGRHILLNGIAPTMQQREGLEGKWIAQITQNMNFVLDMNVGDFLHIHAESLGLEDDNDSIATVMDCANHLCGERFDQTTPLALLSGGQSRSLMIADVACLGKTPVVLLDEIENAGIDKVAALQLFAKQKKILFLASHDPLMILQADFRIVIRNGGIMDVQTPSQEESVCFQEILLYDQRMQEIRRRLRHGERIL